MRKILILVTFIIATSCSPKFEKDFTVEKNDKNYKMWITYYNAEKDSVSINWLIPYQINNNTNRGVKFDFFRKRPEYLRQTREENMNDSLVLFNRLIYKKSSRELLVNCSKIVSVKNIPNYILDNKKAMFSFGEFKKNITKIPPEQIELKKSAYFQKILKEVEKDSIVIVFRDSIADDYFQFKGIVKDKTLKFSK